MNKNITVILFRQILVCIYMIYEWCRVWKTNKTPKSLIASNLSRLYLQCINSKTNNMIFLFASLILSKKLLESQINQTCSKNVSLQYNLFNLLKIIVENVLEELKLLSNHSSQANTHDMQLANAVGSYVMVCCAILKYILTSKITLACSLLFLY